MYLAWLVVVAAFVSTTSVALAEPRVSLDPAPDGTLILAGHGWRPGQRMVVSVGPDLFPVLADSVGDFEVQTGLLSMGGPPELLAVHRPEAQLSPATVGLTAQTDAPHPLAVLFAQTLMTGTAFLGLSAAGLGFIGLAARLVQVRRGTRQL
jgi:hypothetical protein